MTENTWRAIGLTGLLTFGVLTPAVAQTPPGAEPSTGCRLFPLACPGPVPAPPPPLMGPPDEQAATEAPPPVKPRGKQKHRTHKHASKALAQ